MPGRSAEKRKTQHGSPAEQEVVLTDFSYVHFKCATLRVNSGLQGSGKLSKP
jgi:hypothetical protein